MIDARGENGDAAEKGQCSSTDKPIHLQIDHLDHCIHGLFGGTSVDNCHQTFSTLKTK